MPIRRKALSPSAPLRLQTCSRNETAPPSFMLEAQDFQSEVSPSHHPQADEQYIPEKAADNDLSAFPTSGFNDTISLDPVTDNDKHLSTLTRQAFTQAPRDIELVQSPIVTPLSPQWPQINEANNSQIGNPFPVNGTAVNELAAEQIFQESSESNKKTKVISVLQDASLYLGGLIKHPTESTKHFTVLRHSHGLVYYKGPTTSIAITVFADQPLPPDRRYWFQMKGWTGHTGMRAKAFMRTNGNWINVTPARRTTSEALSEMDERAWQRDIRKFMEKAPKSLRSHVVRETAIIRVPFEAADGYFRIVLTKADNRQPLCPSPIFRVASTSMSASSVKGASLSTLPLELSVKVLQFAATTMASNAVAPLANTARSQIASALPSVVSNYGQTAYNLSGAQTEIDTLNNQYNETREIIMQESCDAGSQYIPLYRSDVVGNDDGPETPFPLRLDSRVVEGSGIGTQEVGVPTANLGDAPSCTINTLYGVYFGWAFISPNNKEQRDLHSDWRHAIITISHDYAKTSIAAKKIVRAYIVHDFAGQDFYGAKISLVVMGYLRPVISYKNKEAFFAETLRDIEITRMSLQRDQWGPDPNLQRIKSAKSERSFTDRYVDRRIAAQQQVDKIPVHWLGVKSQSSGLNDRGLYGNGGLYVVRDTP